MATKAEISQFMTIDFPQCNSTVEEIGNRCTTVRHRISSDELRPGGTVSGPVMMAVADAAGTYSVPPTR